jgi:hypothetical protein
MASVLSGVLLGILRRQGVAYRPALEMALPVGFLLALLFWIWLSRQFSIKAIQIPVPIAHETDAQKHGKIKSLTVWAEFGQSCTETRSSERFRECSCVAYSFA